MGRPGDVLYKQIWKKDKGHHEIHNKVLVEKSGMWWGKYWVPGWKETPCAELVDKEAFFHLTISEGTAWLNLINAALDNIIQPRRWKKCAASFISFVKMSLGLMTPGICVIITASLWWRLHTWFLRRFRCLTHLDIQAEDQSTESWLSLYTVVHVCYQKSVPNCRHSAWLIWVPLHTHLLGEFLLHASWEPFDSGGRISMWSGRLAFILNTQEGSGN